MEEQSMSRYGFLTGWQQRLRPCELGGRKTEGGGLKGNGETLQNRARSWNMVSKRLPASWTNDSSSKLKCGALL